MTPSKTEFVLGEVQQPSIEILEFTSGTIPPPPTATKVSSSYDPTLLVHQAEVRVDDFVTRGEDS